MTYNLSYPHHLGLHQHREHHEDEVQCDEADSPRAREPEARERHSCGGSHERREEEPERRTSRSSRTRSANASRGCRTTSNSVPGESRTSSKSLGTSASGPRRTTARSGSEFESEWKGPPVGTETRLLVLSRDFLGSSRRLLRPNLAPEPAKSCASAPLDAIPWESRRGRSTSDFAEGLLCCAARCPSASTDFARPMGPRIQGEAQDRRPPGRHAGPGPT